MRLTKPTYRFLNVLLFIGCLHFLNSCSNEDNAAVDNSIASIQVSTGDLYPEFNKDVKDYYITSLNTLNTIQVTLNDYSSSKEIYINNVKVQNKITDLKLNPGQDIVVRLGSDADDTTYTIHYLPEDMPKTNLITKNNPSDGYILINLLKIPQTPGNDFSYIAILNNDGFPVYYKKIPYNGAINFKYFDIGNNQKRFSYYTLGKEIIMNEKFETIKELETLPFNSHGSYPIDAHDFIYIDDNHYIIPGMYTRQNVDLTAFGGSNSVDLVELVFQEILNNQVVFEWNSADFPELLSEADPIYQAQYATSPLVDYFHFNSLAIDPTDQNFILSARHTNQIYKINRTSGAIMWRFGGSNDDFNLTGNQVISHTHHATVLSNGNLMMFDNGVTKTPQQSRIAEFDLNETTMTANLVYEYKEFGRFFNILGSAQKLDNGNYFIGWGGHTNSQVNGNKSDITEVNPAGNIVLDISFRNDANSFTYSYRALKYNISFDE